MLSNQTLLFSDSSPTDASRTRQLMPYTTTSRDTWGGCHRGNPHSESEATPQPSYSPELESVNVSLPPCCVPAATLPVHSSGYAPQWNAPTLHTSVQDQRYGVTVPYVNDVDRGYGFWTDAQQSAPFAHMTAMNAVTQNQNHDQDAGNAENVPTAYHEDNRIPAGRDLNGWLTTVRFG
ncbi:hypothetical protein BJV77DRAFT_647379 [Russula vinacea]|nr:hypothetical protein BJV77DRAFT_647379 [Russula vinacea]